jgi:hypothetical protein
MLSHYSAATTRHASVLTMWPAKRHLDIFGGLQHPFHPSPVAAGLAA